MRLSLRLQSLLDRCEPGLPVWDLCCDHGHLGLVALASGQFPRVIFNDAVAHVLEDLRTRLAAIARRSPPVASVDVICARAEEIEEALEGNVILAGIGGERIHKILLAQRRRGTLCARHVVVCPEKDAEWLAEQPIPGYALVERLRLAHGKGERWVFRYQLLNEAGSIKNDPSLTT